MVKQGCEPYLILSDIIIKCIWVQGQEEKEKTQAHHHAGQSTRTTEFPRSDFKVTENGKLIWNSET